MHMKMPINMLVLGADVVLGKEKRKMQVNLHEEAKGTTPLQEYVVNWGIL
jgi:hypothetical protein